MSAMPLDLIHGQRIAYFSMEIALRSEIPTYSGGLGVLAGDTMRSAADLDLPIVGVTLVSRAGYFRQDLVDGKQAEQSDTWDPLQWCRPLPARVVVQIGPPAGMGRSVATRGRRKSRRCRAGDPARHRPGRQ